MEDVLVGEADGAMHLVCDRRRFPGCLAAADLRGSDLPDLGIAVEELGLTDPPGAIAAKLRRVLL